MKLTTLSGALRIFAEVERTHLYSHFIRVFLAIAEEGPCTYQRLEELTGLSNSAISRSVLAIGGVNRKGEPGFGLVCVKRDPFEGRRNLVALSEAGKELVGRLEQL